MRLTIDIQSGPHAGERFVCSTGQTLKVGRRPPVDVALSQDSMVSNIHCEFHCTETGVTLRDLGSRFGTTLNGKPVTDAALAVSNGDKMQVGNSVLLLRLRATEAAEQTMTPRELPPQLIRAMDKATGLTVPARPSLIPTTPPGDQPPRRAHDTMTALAPRTDANIELPPLAPPPPAPEMPTDLVVKFLRAQPQPLYALLDAARSPRVLELLKESKEEYQSLYEGDKGVTIAPWGPWLVRLPAESPLLEALVKEGWGESWSVFLTAKASFAEVRKHFRHFLLVRLPDGREVYFRFYDPRVLRTFLPTCSVNESAELFGPIQGFVTESPDRHALFHITATARGAALGTLPI